MERVIAIKASVQGQLRDQNKGAEEGLPGASQEERAGQGLRAGNHHGQVGVQSR